MKRHQLLTSSWNKGVILLFIFITSTQLYAQVEFRSLDELFHYAEEHSLSIKTAELNEEIAQEKDKETKADYLPKFTATLGYTDNIELQPTLLPAQILNPMASEDEVTEVTFGTDYQYNRGIQAQWDLLNFQKLFAAGVSNMEVTKSQINTDLSKFNLYNQLASTYYSIILTQKAIDIYEENVIVAEKTLDNVAHQLKEGMSSEYDYNQALINHRQVLHQLNDAKSNLQQYNVQLQSQLHTSAEITVTDEFTDFEFNEKKELPTHPQVLLQQANLDIAGAQLRQTKAMAYPTLSLVYQRNSTWASNEFFDFADANELPQQLFGATITLNPFNFSNRKRVQQSKINLDIQKLELESVRLEIQKEDELLELQLAQAESDFLSQVEILELQTKNDGHSENLYEKGMQSLDSRLNNYRELLTTQNNYLNSFASLTLLRYKKYIRQLDLNTH